MWGTQSHHFRGSDVIGQTKQVKVIVETPFLALTAWSVEFMDITGCGASSFVMLCLHCSSFQSLFVCEPKSSANETLSWVKISWLTWPWLRLYVLCPSVLGNAVQSFSSIWADLLYITISLLSYELCVFNVCSETAAVFVSSSSVACCCPVWESSTTA